MFVQLKNNGIQSKYKKTNLLKNILKHTHKSKIGHSSVELKCALSLCLKQKLKNIQYK